MSDLKQRIDEMPTRELNESVQWMLRSLRNTNDRLRWWIVDAIIKAAREETDAKITGELEEWLL